jgi:hypothetical protein
VTLHLQRWILENGIDGATERADHPSGQIGRATPRGFRKRSSTLLMLAESFLGPSLWLGLSSGYLPVASAMLKEHIG